MSCSGLRSRQSAVGDEEWWNRPDPVFDGSADAASTHSDHAESCSGWQTHAPAQRQGQGRKRQGSGAYETQPKRRKNARSGSVEFHDVQRPQSQRRGTSPKSYIASGSPAHGGSAPSHASPTSPTSYDLVRQLRPGQEWKVGPHHELAHALNDARTPQLVDWSHGGR